MFLSTADRPIPNSPKNTDLSGMEHVFISKNFNEPKSQHLGKLLLTVESHRGVIPWSPTLGLHRVAASLLSLHVSHCPQTNPLQDAFTCTVVCLTIASFTSVKKK